MKWIDANSLGSVLDPLEAKMDRLLARDEERAMKHSERQTIPDEMCNHSVGRLIVSRRTDKSPNGFTSVICQKLSFQSRGPQYI